VEGDFEVEECDTSDVSDEDEGAENIPQEDMDEGFQFKVPSKNCLQVGNGNLFQSPSPGKTLYSSSIQDPINNRIRYEVELRELTIEDYESLKNL
jgi:hypothetical protein